MNKFLYVKTVQLKNFRNYDELNINLHKNINVIVGDNAQGKTNLLEAIYITSIGRSFRTSLDKDIIKFGESYTYTKLSVSNGNVVDVLSLQIDKNAKKRINVNGLAIKKYADLIGLLLVVSFTPNDLQLIKSGPTERRRFMDIELSQLNNIYFYNLKQYNFVLKQRNNLLKSIQKNHTLEDTLFVWDEQLVEYGSKIINAREQFIEKICEIASKIHSEITQGKEVLTIKYSKNVNIEDYANKLKNSVKRDIILGSTSVGVHKDDILFFINDVDVKSFGSQGQQRTTALSTKLAEIELIKQTKNVTPILLLDDVLSELDSNRQKYLVERIEDIQTIITCTGVESFIDNLIGDVKIYTVNNGKINE